MKVIVIGSGPAGYPAALKLKALGADVKIVEKGDFGGTCLNRGCIPSKAILELAYRYHNILQIKDFFDTPPNGTLLWEKIKEHKSKVVLQIRESLERLFSLKRIPIIKGKARVISKNEIEVQDNEKREIYSFDRLIIATGTTPFYPRPFDKHKDILIDSDGVFDLEYKPKKLIIIGAGVVGIEMACFFNAIGTDVSVVDIMDEILPFEDPSVVRFLKASLEKRGVRFYLSSKVVDITIKGDNKTLIFENGSSIEGDTILVATGRIAKLDDLGLEKVDVKYSKFIEVNRFMQTSNPAIYACGDVNGISMLAHAATKQTEIAANHIMGIETEEFDKDLVPSCIYSFPEYASIGVNTKTAEENSIKVKAKKAYFQVLGKAIATLHREGFIQMLFDENDTLVGAQILGAQATEIIHTLALAVRFKMKAKDINSIIYAHPTMSEIIMEALSKH